MARIKTKYKLEDLIKDYELKNLGISNTVMQAIIKLINQAYTDVAYFSARARLVNNRTLPKHVQEKIKTVVDTLTNRIGMEIRKGAIKAWALSEQKVDLVEKTAIGGDIPPTKTFLVSSDMESNYSRIRKEFGTGSEAAARQFMKKELNVSGRVWKKSASKFIKDTLVEGIKTGRSARELSKDLRNATLSKNNKMKSTGPGVYKDPKKNAYRLARNEINKAYLANDHRRYQASWWVIGKEIKTSISHPKYDMCDVLAGIYPKDFVFPKWHPNCLCYEVPKLATVEEREAMLDYNMGLTDVKPNIKYIKKIPAAVKAWVKANEKRIAGWKTTPEFITSNTKYF